MKVVGARVLRDLDRATIAGGLPGEVLMEQAGVGAAVELWAWCRRLPERHCRRFLVVAGKGNNGGDGYVVARWLAEHVSLPVRLFSVCPRETLRGEALCHARRLPPGVAVASGERLAAADLAPGTVVVDALLGTGSAGPVKEPCAGLIAQINEAGLPVVALDLPSGIDADTGTVANVAIRADLTITMGLPKPGLFRDEGLARRGILRVVELDYPAALLAAQPALFEAPFRQDLARWLGRLPATTHKGDMGRILVWGGSAPYPGAPLLAGLGALRLGAGLVTVAFPASLGPRLRPPALALILRPVDDAGGGCHRHWEPVLGTDQDILVLGPGLGRAPDTLDSVAAALAGPQPVVLDADGLEVFARHPGVLPRPAPTVLTPHPGEMARLLRYLDRAEWSRAERSQQALYLAQQLGAVVVLKGAATIVAAPDGRLAVNTSGTPGLASGGTGDVLAGMLAACLVQVPDPYFAAQLAVFVHGLAAELAPGGQRHLIADQLLDLLGPALRELSPFA